MGLFLLKMCFFFLGRALFPSAFFAKVHYDPCTKGLQGKHLKFQIAKHPKGPYKQHIVVRVDTGADVNCMNEKTFNECFPEVQLSVCCHEIQNFRNSIADISILGQFHTYLEFRGEKYLNTSIVTNVNDCPNLLSYGATFRMGVLLPNYPEENIDIQRLPDPAGFMTKTVPVQFQYSAQTGAYNKYSTDGTARNFFQDHHTLLTSYDNSYDNKTGQPSTGTQKYFTEWTSSTLCTCPQIYSSSLQTR